MNQYEELLKQLDLNPDFKSRYAILTPLLKAEYQKFMKCLFRGELEETAWSNCSHELYDCDLINASCRACYPLSGRITPFKVKLSNAREVYAMCAFDALSLLSLTGAQIILSDDTVITLENLNEQSLRVWIPNAHKGCCVASKSCCSIEFLSPEKAENKKGLVYTLPEAYKLSIQLFDFTLDNFN